MRSVPNFRNYFVTEDGKVYNAKYKRYLKTEITANGYCRVDLRQDGQRRREYVHVLVAELFLGSRPDGLVVEHLNGDPLDNRVENLKYSTQQENLLRRDEHGTTPVGEKHWRSILLDTQRQYVLDSDKTAPELAEELGVSRGCIHQIRLRYRRKNDND